MSDHYTPDTENVRTIYAQDAHSEARRKDYEAEFDRWLAAHEAKLIDETNKRGQVINEIMKLHTPEKIFDDWYCSHCLETVNYETDQATYPCATVKILLKHPGHEPLAKPTEDEEPR